jgi:hypothetical protein
MHQYQALGVAGIGVRQVHEIRAGIRTAVIALSLAGCWGRTAP